MAGTAADRVLVDRLALKTPLGRGGIGLVWHAHDVVLGREVAVKEVIFPASMSAAEQAATQTRVTREARASARLNHPGVVTLYDVVTSQDSVFLVMELVEAPTLAELVGAKGPLAPERVAEIGAQVASAPASRKLVRVLCRPGSCTLHRLLWWSFSRSLHRGLLQPTRPHSTEYLPNLT